MKILLKKGIALLMIKIKPIAKSGVVQTKINAIFALMIKDIVSEKISINGERTAVLIQAVIM